MWIFFQDAWWGLLTLWKIDLKAVSATWIDCCAAYLAEVLLPIAWTKILSQMLSGIFIEFEVWWFALILPWKLRPWFDILVALEFSDWFLWLKHLITVEHKLFSFKNLLRLLWYRIIFNSLSLQSISFGIWFHSCGWWGFLFGGTVDKVVSVIPEYIWPSSSCFLNLSKKLLYFKNFPTFPSIRNCKKSMLNWKSPCILNHVIPLLFHLSSGILLILWAIQMYLVFSVIFVLLVA